MADNQHGGHGHDIGATAHGGHGGDHGDLFQTYMTIAVILAVCTASSFAFNWLASEKIKAITVFTSFLLILGVGIIKAYLVGTYFMHLKWDWRMLYFLIVPAFILGAMMMVVFLPDVYFGPIHDGADALKIAEELAAQ